MYRRITRCLLNRKSDKKIDKKKAKDKLTDINNSVNINDEITAKNASIFTFSNNNNDNIHGNSIASTSAQYLTFETIENEKPMRKKKLLEKESYSKIKYLGEFSKRSDVEYETRSDAFQWDDRSKRDQKDRYMPHQESYSNSPNTGNLRYDTSNHNNFLISISADILPIRLIGTTDLKKSVNDGHLYQALAELTAGDLKSTHAVLAVLTYLRDDWQSNGSIAKKAEA
ncbi:18011_t:CDS:2 [Rhizophagus irregularis]|nr:18011_t:CDS:2 [Rhizophagus irregularis]